MLSPDLFKYQRRIEGNLWGTRHSKYDSVPTCDRHDFADLLGVEPSLNIYIGGDILPMRLHSLPN